MKTRLVVLGLIWAVLPAFGLARDLTVVSWGGKFQAIQDRVYFRPFADASKISISNQSWDGGAALLKAKVDDQTDDWDVVLVDGKDLAQGCKTGIFEPINWASLGGRAHYLKNAVSDCGAGAIVYSIVLAYDPEKQKHSPASWQDFWDQKKYPGKRGLRIGPKANLEIALMADGIKPENVYAALSTPAGIDRAFKKLDEIKEYISWWEKGAEPAQMLGAGAVTMTSTYNTQLAAANKRDKKNFKMAWTNSLYMIDSWAVLKGSSHRQEAEQFLVYVSKPEIQKTLPQQMPYGVTNKDATALIEGQAALADLPSNPEYLKTALYVDENFWLANEEKLTQRFKAWLLK